MRSQPEPVVDLRSRTKAFALRIVRLYTALPKTTESQVVGKQLLRSEPRSRHHREGHRARSTAEFISKLEVGLQELDETVYWLELLIEGGMVSAAKLADLLDEANQIIAVRTACVKARSGDANEGRLTFSSFILHPSSFAFQITGRSAKPAASRR